MSSVTETNILALGKQGETLNVIRQRLHFERIKMSSWSLSQVLGGLHDDIEKRLAIARKSFSHPGTKGNASENVWLEMLQTYLPP